LSTGVFKDFGSPVVPRKHALGGVSVITPIHRGAVGTLLTAREVAASLRVCTATVYKLCAAGALPHVRVLNAVRVAVEDLERFLANVRRSGWISE
jgi:excisionase family DNA binding protein